MPIERLEKLDREIIETMLACLRPFARAYVGCTPSMQIALNEHCPVRIIYLRDAFLMCAKIEQMMRNRDMLPGG